jgi:hypothetical protein
MAPAISSGQLTESIDQELEALISQVRETFDLSRYPSSERVFELQSGVDTVTDKLSVFRDRFVDAVWQRWTTRP